MKFAQTFSEELKNHEYPAEWQDAAIRYRLLKKCIKKIMKELDGLGLNAAMLKLLQAESEAERKVLLEGEGIGNLRIVEVALNSRRYSVSSDETDSSEQESVEWQQVAEEQVVVEDEVKKEMDENEEVVNDVRSAEVDITTMPEPGVSLKYWFDGTLQEFVPKLVLTIGEDCRIPPELELTPETRRALERLFARQKQEPFHDEESEDQNSAENKSKMCSTASGLDTLSDDRHVTETPLEIVQETNSRQSHRYSLLADARYSSYIDFPSKIIQIPLSADAEFFQLLTSKIFTLDVVQSKEEKDISAQVVSLGNRVTDVTKPQILSSHSDLYPWREIFQSYVEAGIFFNTSETDRGQRPVEKAEERLSLWLTHVKNKKLTRQFKHKNSSALFGDFININMAMLRLLRFQSINKTAMTKILKKFDKRTSLNVKEKYPTFISVGPFLSHHLAKALCYTLTNHLLCLIPQLDDYLCPICSSIAIKPVRLSCMHVFCVRCLVKLQRDRKSACPICRSDVVLNANAGNLDVALLNFLVSYFPKESKEKQAENEREVTMEIWKGVQDGGESCVVM